MDITLTDAAASAIAAVIERHNRNLRVRVEAHGCGRRLEWDYYLDDRLLEGDIVTKFGDVEVVVHKFSEKFVDGIVIGYVDDNTVAEPTFTIDNLNVSGACGFGNPCGTPCLAKTTVSR